MTMTTENHNDPGTALERATVNGGGGALTLSSGQTQWTPQQRAALTQLGLSDATDADLAVFLHQAQRTGLDPFARQIYMIARWDQQLGRNKYTIQTGIDGLRVVAERHGKYGGQVGPEWCGDDGVWHDVWVSQKPPAAARVGVVRKDWTQPAYATAMFREYAGYTRKGDLTRMWREKPAVMIAKCAEALALRKAFPHDLSGLYTADEMAQAEPAAQPQVEPPKRQQQAETPDWDAKLAEAEGDPDKLRDLWSLARGMEPNNQELLERIAQAGKAAQDGAQQTSDVVDGEVVPDEPEQQAERDSTAVKRLFALMRDCGVDTSDRDDRLRVQGALVGRELSSTNDMTPEDIELAVGILDPLARDDNPSAALDAVLLETQEQSESGLFGGEQQ